MKRVFEFEQKFPIPDGTAVFPFLNSKDALQRDLPWDIVEDFSVSAVEIPANFRSKIHVMPHVTQVSFVLCGAVCVHMKDDASTAPYTLALVQHQAVLTKPGTFLQFENTTPDICQILCIVSPAYLFEPGSEGQPVYDDSIMIEWSWDDLSTRWNWKPPELANPAFSAGARRASYERMRRYWSQNSGC